MVSRKRRTPVVIDTNVLIRNFRSRSLSSPNRKIFRLWLAARGLQLVVSPELVKEYLEIIERVLGAEREMLEQWSHRLTHDRRCTLVNLGRRYTESRDPDDSIVLATAAAGRAEYLITNDRDLLELPADFPRTLPFDIVTPSQFMAAWE